MAICRISSFSSLKLKAGALIIGSNGIAFHLLNLISAIIDDDEWTGTLLNCLFLLVHGTWIYGVVKVKKTTTIKTKKKTIN